MIRQGLISNYLNYETLTCDEYDKSQSYISSAKFTKEILFKPHIDYKNKGSKINYTHFYNYGSFTEKFNKDKTIEMETKRFNVYNNIENLVLRKDIYNKSYLNYFVIICIKL